MAYGFQNDKSKVDIIDLVYPVGSIYMSVNNVNPSTLFGGTWVAWGSGRVPVGVNTGDSNFNTVEKTGGASTHTLTAQQMPSHSHQYVSYNPTDERKFAVDSSLFANNGLGVNGPIGERSTETSGSGQAHNNLQPYITCYMWKRTA